MSTNSSQASDDPVREFERLSALFETFEKNQVDTLDSAAKRIIELTTALLGVLFAVVALGSDFPPPYLSGNAALQNLTTLALILYVVAMLASVLCLQPRRYSLYTENLSRLREEYRRLMDYKRWTLRIAGVSFFAASTTLAVLIIAIVRAA
jgi:succinate dehydrogenase hydrophobic anchor subunit